MLPLSNLAATTRFTNSSNPKVWKDIDAYAKEWLALIGQLKARSPETCDGLSDLLTQLRSNNAKWMNIAARQFAKSINRYCEPESGRA